MKLGNAVESQRVGRSAAVNVANVTVTMPAFDVDPVAGMTENAVLDLGWPAVPASRGAGNIHGPYSKRPVQDAVESTRELHLYEVIGQIKLMEPTGMRICKHRTFHC